jgi:citrate synthase
MTETAARDWWRTNIINIEPGVIQIRGYDIQDLIGNISFPEQIWLMLRGELPTRPQSQLLEAALVAAVDHGPQAPSISIARMSATCGIDLNNSVASAVNALGDIHGGAGQQAMVLYETISRRVDGGASVEDAAFGEIEQRINAKAMIEGFGHRFHPIDPRAPRLLALVEDAAAAGVVTGRYARIGRVVETALEQIKKKHLPMNIDGATAVIYAELGFPAELGRGLFILSRSVGILAHAWEQRCQGGRIKGPMPPSIPYNYTGRAPRSLGETA